MLAVISFIIGIVLTLIYIPINASLTVAKASVRTSRLALSKMESKAEDKAVKSTIKASRLSLLALEKLIGTLKRLLNLIKSAIVTLLSVSSLVSLLVLLAVLIVVASVSWIALYFTALDEDDSMSKVSFSMAQGAPSSLNTIGSGASTLVANAEKLGNWYESIYSKVGASAYNNSGGCFKSLYASESWYDSKLKELNALGLEDTRMDCSGYLTSILAMSGFFSGKGWNGKAYGSYRWNPKRSECKNEPWLYDNILSKEFTYYDMENESSFDFEVGDIIVSDYHIEIIGEIKSDNIWSYSWGFATDNCLRPRSSPSAYVSGSSVGLHHMSVVWRLN